MLKLRWSSHLRSRLRLSLTGVTLVAVLAGCGCSTVPRAPLPDWQPTPMAPAVFRGLGTWVDVYDWSPTVTGGRPSVLPADTADMAAHGVQTLYLQSARTADPAGVIDPVRFGEFITSAHAHGISVVGWFLPDHTNPQSDVNRLLSVRNAGVDGIGLDIESRRVSDVSVRNDALVQTVQQLRASIGDFPIAAIIYPPTQMEINPSLWPNFPFATLDPLVDVWMPMAYWTFRRSGQPELDDGYVFTTRDFTLLRQLTGNPQVAVHEVGGLAEDLLTNQAYDMVRAIREQGGLGASVYDYATSPEELWEEMSGARYQPV